GETRFGGSTLSQQTVKNLFLNQTQSYFRKLQEAVITRDLERHFSKNEIIELYLNMAEFGPDLYGVRDAARYYFDKKPAEINAAEGAWLALMLPSPRRYHYTVYQNRNLTTSLKRKYQRILQGMRQSNYISSVQYRRYLRMIEKTDWPAKS
ncbi:MAG: biosynthetic peptidoglycan transglycosylase, partial [Oceanospirillum sp.]|nr:biosynthetic peptidoglycan transglycosylase [Oceanospirillum sp.]